MLKAWSCWVAAVVAATLPPRAPAIMNGRYRCPVPRSVRKLHPPRSRPRISIRALPTTTFLSRTVSAHHNAASRADSVRAIRRSRVKSAPAPGRAPPAVAATPPADPHGDGGEAAPRFLSRIIGGGTIYAQRVHRTAQRGLLRGRDANFAGLGGVRVQSWRLSAAHPGEVSAPRQIIQDLWSDRLLSGSPGDRKSTRLNSSH